MLKYYSFNFLFILPLLLNSIVSSHVYANEIIEELNIQKNGEFSASPKKLHDFSVDIEARCPDEEERTRTDKIATDFKFSRKGLFETYFGQQNFDNQVRIYTKADKELKLNSSNHNQLVVETTDGELVVGELEVPLEEANLCVNTRWRDIHRTNVNFKKDFQVFAHVNKVRVECTKGGYSLIGKREYGLTFDIFVVNNKNEGFKLGKTTKSYYHGSCTSLSTILSGITNVLTIPFQILRI